MGYELVSKEDDKNNPQLEVFKVKLPENQVAWEVAIDLERALSMDILGGECPYPENKHLVVFWIAKAHTQTAKELLKNWVGPAAQFGPLL